MDGWTDAIVSQLIVSPQFQIMHCIIQKFNAFNVDKEEIQNFPIVFPSVITVDSQMALFLTVVTTKPQHTGSLLD